jgi:hypothetical protein
MRIGCPIALAQARQIGLRGRAQEVPAAPGCPIEVQQAARFEFLPERRAQQREEPREAVTPLTQPDTKPPQDIGPERRPHLPAHGVGAVAQEIRQLQGLFQFLEEELDVSPAAIQVRHTLRSDEVGGEKGHFPPFAPAHSISPAHRTDTCVWSETHASTNPSRCAK